MTVWNGSRRPEAVAPAAAGEFHVWPSAGPIWELSGPDGKGDTVLWARCTDQQRAEFIADLLNGERPLVQALMALRVMGGLRPGQQEEIGKVLAKAGLGA